MIITPATLRPAKSIISAPGAFQVERNWLSAAPAKDSSAAVRTTNVILMYSCLSGPPPGGGSYRRPAQAPAKHQQADGGNPAAGDADGDPRPSVALRARERGGQRHDDEGRGDDAGERKRVDAGCRDRRAVEPPVPYRDGRGEHPDDRRRQAAVHGDERAEREEGGRGSGGVRRRGAGPEAADAANEPSRRCREDAGARRRRSVQAGQQGERDHGDRILGADEQVRHAVVDRTKPGRHQMRDDKCGGGAHKAFQQKAAPAAMIPAPAKRSAARPTGHLWTSPSAIPTACRQPVAPTTPML